MLHVLPYTPHMSDAGMQGPCRCGSSMNTRVAPFHGTSLYLADSGCVAADDISAWPHRAVADPDDLEDASSQTEDFSEQEDANGAAGSRVDAVGQRDDTRMRDAEPSPSVPGELLTRPSYVFSDDDVRLPGLLCLLPDIPSI